MRPETETGTRPDPTELAWWAFRYVACELAVAEEADFEALMADDQSAREALAEAVEMVAAVAAQAPAAIPLATPDRRRTRAVRHALGWMAAGAAACLVVLIGFRAVGPRPELSGPSAVVAIAGATPPDVLEAEPTGAVALTWSGLRRVAAEDDTDAEAEADPAWSADWPDESIVAESEADLPSWLLEATALPDMGGSAESNRGL